MPDGPSDGKIMLLSHTLTVMGSDAASLVEFYPVIKEIVCQTGGLMMGAGTDRHMEK